MSVFLGCLGLPLQGAPENCAQTFNPQQAYLEGVEPEFVSKFWAVDPRETFQSGEIHSPKTKSARAHAKNVIFFIKLIFWCQNFFEHFHQNQLQMFVRSLRAKYKRTKVHRVFRQTP